MREDSLFLLVPYRANRQIAFVDAKSSFGLSELDIGVPQFFGCPIRDVAAQQVASLA